MTFNQILNVACVAARAYARDTLADEQLLGAQRGIAAAANADSYEHLAQLLTDSRQDDYAVMHEWGNKIANASEYWLQHHNTLYIELIYDVVTIYLLLQDRPISAAAIRTYAKMVGGERE